VPKLAPAELAHPTNAKPKSASTQLELIWLVSFLFWGMYALFTGPALYQRNVSLGYRTTFAFEISSFLVPVVIYAALTPLVYLAGLKYPITTGNVRRRLLPYLAGGMLFAALHLIGKLQFYPTLDLHSHLRWLFFQPGTFMRFRKLYLFNLFDDLFMVYAPALLVAHAVVYHRTSTQNSVRASELQKQLAEAQLQALKIQLHPHFLFNTMNSISALMHIDVAAADKMMTRLSDLLRMTLERPRTQETTLGDELEFLGAYLSIEQVRLRERLKTVIEIQRDTREALVPYLLLQPLVENAIRHGISKTESGGAIVVSSTRVNGRLHIEVSDNGPGFQNGFASSSSGIGLKITRERLQALYGTDHDFQVHSAPGSGTAVVIDIPFRTQ